jgi:hypothetical protein
MRRRPLPQIVVSVPCHVDWNTMTRIDADGRTRFCERCERPVYDSASMTRNELADLIAWHEGRRLPCVRLHRRPDGTIVTRSCLEPLFRAGRFVWLQVGLAAAAFWGLLALHPLSRFFRRDAGAPFSSEEEEIDSPRRGTYVMQGILNTVPPKPPTEEARLLARTPRSNGWPFLPEADRAPPLRTLEAEEEIWKPGKRR